MENKYVKYGLIIAVISVWALIVFRVIKGFGKSEVPPTENKHSPVNGYKSLDDTFSLVLNYPDPFLPTLDSVIEDTVVKAINPVGPNTNTVNVDPPPTKEMVTGIVQYTGIISNPQKKSKIAIINIQGKEFLMKENESNEEIRLMKIEKTLIRILYKGKVFEIGKTN
jgi:hypothetical protein